MSEKVLSAERIVTELTPDELTQFATWFAEFHETQWDQQIEADSNAGRLDALIAKANEDFEAGLAREI
jgi:hypothetical protein